MARPPKTVKVTEADQRQLDALLRAGNTPQKIVERARIILLFAKGLTSIEIAAETGCSVAAVYRWSRRYSERGLDGLQDLQRSGRPRTLAPSKAAEILDLTVHKVPREATLWSLRLMAEAVGTCQRL